MSNVQTRKNAGENMQADKLQSCRIFSPRKVLVKSSKKISFPNEKLIFLLIDNYAL